MQIGRLERVPLKEVWQHETKDFTRWLVDNLDYLQEITGLQLSLVEREASAGDFSADILAEDGDGNMVVIENQLGTSDHDHLGKVLTYMSNLNAKTAIWIVGNPRVEHEKAVHWLNEILPADMAVYLLKVEVVRIGDSAPAPLFSVVAGPSAESRQIGAQRKQLAEHQLLRQEFWKQLLEKARQRTDLHAGVSPSKENCLATGAGKTGLIWSYVVLKDHARVELYIDTPDADRNRAIFKKLVQHRETVEREFGGSLDWECEEWRRATRICYRIRGHGGLRDRDRWTELQDAMIDAMVRLEKALGPLIRQLS
ncbi:MAG: DUF4268 domain-containing protein [Planctomycetota bacterium]|nr:MAG: DUF4268 domain-containing protein [Planctomycetota bacterium]